jgi:hypothetical protein
VLRSGGMGEFVFTPPGRDEELLRAAGFDEIQVEDRTPNMAAVSGAWRAARARREAQLDELEGSEANARHQEFLATVSGSRASGGYHGLYSSRAGPDGRGLQERVRSPSAASTYWSARSRLA